MCGVREGVEHGGEVLVWSLDHACSGDLGPSLVEFCFVLVCVFEQDLEPVVSCCGGVCGLVACGELVEGRAGVYRGVLQEAVQVVVVAWGEPVGVREQSSFAASIEAGEYPKMGLVVSICGYLSRIVQCAAVGPVPGWWRGLTSV